MTGLVRRVNMWPDPLFKTLKPSVTYGGTVAHGSNNQATWHATNDNNGCGWEFTNLGKNTAMVFRCFLWFSDPNTKVALQIYGYDPSGHPLTSFTPNSTITRPVLKFNTGTYEKIRIEFSAVNGGTLNIGETNLESNTSIVYDVSGRPPARQRLLRFTAPLDGHVRVCFRGPSEVDGKIGFYDIQLELASTFDAAVSGGGSASSPGTPCRDRNGIRRAGGAR